MRYLIAAIAIAPFAALLLSMATGRAHVRTCCAPVSHLEPPATTSERDTSRTARPSVAEQPTTAVGGWSLNAACRQAATPL